MRVPAEDHDGGGAAGVVTETAVCRPELVARLSIRPPLIGRRISNRSAGGPGSIATCPLTYYRPDRWTRITAALPRAGSQGSADWSPSAGSAGPGAVIAAAASWGEATSICVRRLTSAIEPGSHSCVAGGFPSRLRYEGAEARRYGGRSRCDLVSGPGGNRGPLGWCQGRASGW